MLNKDIGFDAIRTFAIFFVLFAHAIDRQTNNENILLFFRSMSPGLTMSMLGFISGYLLINKSKSYDGLFFIKRFSRIYISLFICLSAISIWHFYLGYNVINQHSIYHFMGLSFFLDLFSVENQSSIGAGLWFITIIIIMYLLIPVIKTLYSHKNRLIHLVLIILGLLAMCNIFVRGTSGWNVIMAFNIGCFIGLNSNIESHCRKSVQLNFLSLILIVLVCGFATAKIIPYNIRMLLFPLYPFFAVPFFYNVGWVLKGWLLGVVSWFSGISYEVYILHFYFIENDFFKLLPGIKSVAIKVVISLVIVLILSWIFSKLSNQINKRVVSYFIKQ